MNVGIVGNPRYRGLAAILSGIAARGPGLGLSFFTEPELAPLWEGSANQGRIFLACPYSNTAQPAANVGDRIIPAQRRRTESLSKLTCPYGSRFGAAARTRRRIRL